MKHETTGYIRVILDLNYLKTNLDIIDLKVNNMKKLKKQGLFDNKLTELENKLRKIVLNFNSDKESKKTSKDCKSKKLNIYTNLKNLSPQSQSIHLIPRPSSRPCPLYTNIQACNDYETKSNPVSTPTCYLLDMTNNQKAMKNKKFDFVKSFTVDSIKQSEIYTNNQYKRKNKNSNSNPNPSLDPRMYVNTNSINYDSSYVSQEMEYSKEKPTKPKKQIYKNDVECAQRSNTPINFEIDTNKNGNFKDYLKFCNVISNNGYYNNVESTRIESIEHIKHVNKNINKYNNVHNNKNRIKSYKVYSKNKQTKLNYDADDELKNGKNFNYNKFKKEINLPKKCKFNLMKRTSSRISNFDKMKCPKCNNVNYQQKSKIFNKHKYSNVKIINQNFESMVTLAVL
ncbi:hypothetical protein A3Q56_05726 [Intoshia linei]|uniref:Uncharacterized protein n=1 Tax=Intoshia linei TaxID=1819745 RepID=A0A177AWU4_9BILA|nr:hypothetical protein A3Q56_05726 [Intoshia linei]